MAREYKEREEQAKREVEQSQKRTRLLQGKRADVERERQQSEAHYVAAVGDASRARERHFEAEKEYQDSAARHGTIKCCLCMTPFH